MRRVQAICGSSGHGLSARRQAGMLASRVARQAWPAPPYRALCRANATGKAATVPTLGQKLRGHGPDGWQGAGYNYDKAAPQLGPELRELLVHYGQLCEATYDRLGLDPGDPSWGYATVPADQLIAYLTQDYPLAPNAKKDEATPLGTKDIYSLPPPTSDGLSPLIYALPGQHHALDGGGQEGKLWGPVERLVDFLFSKASRIPVEVIFGSRPLFVEDPATGRGKVERPAFMGYVAVSTPQGPGQEVDVAFVWRGTIYKEEWESNFAQDRLVKFDPEHHDDDETAKPWEVGVHDGFGDLYIRKAQQPIGNTGELGQPESPHQVVRAWLAHLLRSHNVTTISTTGHSLGGALSTVSAFAIGRELDRLWAVGNESERADFKVKDKPTVTAFAFAPPRVGNFTFLKEFSDTHRVKELRVCNKGDEVPRIPGFWVQTLTFLADRVHWDAYSDMDSRGARIFAQLYYAATKVSAKLGFPSSRWGYFHVGAILEIDSDKDFGGVGVTPAGSFGPHHNLEVYLYLLSKLGTADGATSRNPLLINKGDDILADKALPANWWRYARMRGCRLNASGRWEHEPPATAAAAASTGIGGGQQQ